jgi:hypothetical protein
MGSLTDMGALELHTNRFGVWDVHIRCRKLFPWNFKALIPAESHLGV